MIILENTKEYKDTKLAIPVGIGVLQTEAVKNFYNTSDADATNADILINKTAYGKDGKIIGTLDLDAEKEISYQEGYEFGYNEGNEAGYQLGYNEGNEAGIEIGKAEVIEGMNDATITAGTVFKGEIGYGKDGERIVGDYEFVEGFDFGVIGYSENDSNTVNRSISDDIAYSKTLYDAWDPSRTSAQGYFQYNTKLIYAPKIDTSNVTNMKRMFYQCSNITTVPLFDTSNVTDMRDMFYQCSNITTGPSFDTSNVTTMYNMFGNCRNLTSVPAFNTSKVTDMGNMFYDTMNLTTVPEFDTSSVANVNNMFGSLINQFQTSDLGGFINLGKSFSHLNTANNHLNLTRLNKLTYQSCMNVINKVYDMNLTNVTNAQISFNSTTKALLSSDDIAIATSKGWTVS